MGADLPLLCFEPSPALRPRFSGMFSRVAPRPKGRTSDDFLMIFR
jgi:hypothetical protein